MKIRFIFKQMSIHECELLKQNNWDAYYSVTSTDVLVEVGNIKYFVEALEALKIALWDEEEYKA